MGSKVLSVEDDGRSGRSKDATADENVKVMHTLVMYDRRRDLRSTPAKWAYVLEQYNQSLLTS